MRQSEEHLNLIILEQVNVFLDEEVVLIDDLHVHIHSQINQHTRAVITGRVKAGAWDSYVTSLKDDSHIKITHHILGNKVMEYHGLVINIDTETQGTEGIYAVYYIKIEAISYSYKLDIYKKNRSFQKIEMSYDELLKTIQKDYSKADIYNQLENKSKKLDQFVLQWKDTDWEFLLREASKFNAGLYVESSEERARFYFGEPQGLDRGILENYNYTISKNLENARKNINNEFILEQNEFDYIQYTILENHAKEVFSLGDTIQYQHVTLYICEIVTKIIDHKLYNIYTLTSKNGLKQPRIYNQDLQGLSLVGEVIQVEKNLLKLHLFEIDSEQKIEDAYWFDYAAFYATQYAMPELTDIVNLHFPTVDETTAIAINSFKWNPEKGYHRNNRVVTPENTSAEGHLGPIQFEISASDPDVKLFTTPFGRMIELGPDRICIELNDGTYIIMSDAENKAGIQIYTEQNIELHADGKTQISANKKIEMTANEQILLHTENAQIEITPNKIELRADEIINHS